jgi:hypothetical protein
MTDGLVECGRATSHDDVAWFSREFAARATGRTGRYVTQAMGGLLVGHLRDRSLDQSLRGRRRDILHVGQRHI